MMRWIALTLGFSVCAAALAGADLSVPTYTASYRVEYNGKDAGTAEFSVRYLADDEAYEFTSRTMAKGLLKLARPNPAIDRSRFRVNGATLQPLEFWHEDGSRSGEDNFHIQFDWQRKIATVSSESGKREMALPPAALDRGSLQVALTRDVATAGKPGGYQTVDDDSVSAYEYTDAGVTTIKTGAGTYEARVFTQQRAGSSRTTSLWLAPAVRFLPVRIEQRRGDDVTAFDLIKVADPSADAAKR